ncbi:MAG: hypothetical protein OXI53_05700 [Nitrospira sp.]|nr:hypothetical protein [Nitrospira sp.]MDE0404787.1 hypothetical protein [Nitrospira sp.]MDE0487077.1 hypothetical protein [Nitrospira sp.]
MIALQKSFYEELRQTFNDHSVFQVRLRGRNEIRLKSEDDEIYLNREMEKAICRGWCARHTEHRESFINGTAIAVEQCEYRTQNGGWTCSFILRIIEPFHGRLLYKALEYAGESLGIGEETPYYNYGRFDIQSMEPIDGNGDS